MRLMPEFSAHRIGRALVSLVGTLAAVLNSGLQNMARSEAYIVTSVKCGVVHSLVNIARVRDARVQHIVSKYVKSTQYSLHMYLYNIYEYNLYI